MESNTLDMNKYEKAVAYINDVLCGMTRAEIAGLNDDMVYVFTDVTDIQFRIHDSEVQHLADKYDFFHNSVA